MKDVVVSSHFSSFCVKLDLFFFFLTGCPDVTGAGNHRENPRLHESVPHRAGRRESLIDLASLAITPVEIGLSVIQRPLTAGAAHRRGFQEDPEGGREEEEKGGKEERDQERPSHLPLPLGTIAPPLQRLRRAEAKEIGAHFQSSVGGPTC